MATDKENLKLKKMALNLVGLNVDGDVELTAGRTLNKVHVIGNSMSLEDGAEILASHEEEWKPKTKETVKE